MSIARPVLHLIDTTGPGGAETVYLQVASGLADREWPARAVLVGPGWVADRTKELGLPLDIVETDRSRDLRFLRALRSLVRRHRIGLIHAHLFSPAVYASLVGAWARLPVIATFHGASDIPGGGLGGRLRYGLVRRQSRVVCVSESLRVALVSQNLADEREVSVIHNGVDLDLFRSADGSRVRREHGVGEDTVLIGALGNIREAKDFPNLIGAAARLATDARLAFAIVGERTEPLHGELRALRDRLGLHDRVSFWGFRDDAPDVLAAFDVLAISSESEGFSLAAVQAMAAGTPVVATRSGGPEEILTDGLDGVLVEKGSPEALAAGIRRVVDDAGLRTRLVTHARETAERRFSLTAMLDAYRSLYEEAVGVGGPGRGGRAPRERGSATPSSA